MLKNSSNSDINSFLSIFKNDLECLEFDGVSLTVRIKSQITIYTEVIKKLFSNISELPQNQIEINLLSCLVEKTFFFFELKNFLSNYEKISEDFDQNRIIVLKDDNDYILKEPEDTFDQENLVLFNIREYRLVLNLFLNTPEFTTYKSRSDDLLTIISKKNGVFDIGYKFPQISFFLEYDLTGLHTRIRNEFKKKEFIQFFKEIVIESIFNVDIENRFNNIITEHNILLNLATRDFESYVSNFAFDKIKSKFKDEREKYFESIDRNIASIGKQVISFPLTFGATIFASYKVKDQAGFLILILIGYFLYTVIAFLILNMTAYNIKCLKDDVINEENTIKNSYNVIFKEFEPDFKKIKKKIFNLRIIVYVLFSVLILLLILFIIYTLINLKAFDSVENVLDFGIIFC